MDESLKLYWETYFNRLQTEKIIRQSSNPLREYEDEFIEGSILDIGCGQSNFLLEYANNGKIIYALDSEQFQLDFLRKRAEKVSNCNFSNWNFLNFQFPTDALPQDNYSLIILSNILHFFTIEDCKEIEASLDRISQRGTLIYIGVHSYTYYANNPNDPNNNEYFKHYFQIDDFEEIFPIDKYERVYVAQIDKIYPAIAKQIINEWLDKYYEKEGITDVKFIANDKKEYLKNNTQSDIQMILRKQ